MFLVKLILLEARIYSFWLIIQMILALNLMFIPLWHNIFKHRSFNFQIIVLNSLTNWYIWPILYVRYIGFLINLKCDLFAYNSDQMEYDLTSRGIVGESFHPNWHDQQVHWIKVPNHKLASNEFQVMEEVTRKMGDAPTLYQELFLISIIS
jgi:hypothetical protein